MQRPDTQGNSQNQAEASLGVSVETPGNAEYVGIGGQTHWRTLARGLFRLTVFSVDRYKVL